MIRQDAHTGDNRYVCQAAITKGHAMMRCVVFALIGVLGVGAFSSAEAQSRRELAARLDATEVRLAEVEVRALQGDPVAEILMRRLDSLEREQRALTGEVERLAFENRTMRTELEQMGRDVDALLDGAVSTDGSGPVALGGDEDEIDPFAEVRAQATGTLTMPTETTEVSEEEIASNERGLAESRPDVQAVETSGLTSLDGGSDLVGSGNALSADDIYTQGRTRLLEGDFDGARESFASFTRDHTGHAQADEAFFWLGETYYISGQFDQAADAYIASLQSDRAGPQGPDALVRLAASLAGLGHSDRACQVLATFPGEYPNASADDRRKAQREVARIGC
jgi:tol-pal system protein YbgF